jgi:hypothetical protein
MDAVSCDVTPTVTVTLKLPTANVALPFPAQLSCTAYVSFIAASASRSSAVCDPGVPITWPLAVTVAVVTADEQE